jgi:hypothetical protein
MSVRRTTDDVESYLDYHPRKDDPFKKEEDKFEKKKPVDPDQGDWDEFEGDR